MARKVSGTPLASKKKRSYRSKRKMNYEVIGIVLIAFAIFIGIRFFTSAAGVAGEYI